MGSVSFQEFEFISGVWMQFKYSVSPVGNLAAFV